MQCQKDFAGKYLQPVSAMNLKALIANKVRAQTTDHGQQTTGSLRYVVYELWAIACRPLSVVCRLKF